MQHRGRHGFEQSEKKEEHPPGVKKRSEGGRTFAKSILVIRIRNNKKVRKRQKKSPHKKKKKKKKEKNTDAPKVSRDDVCGVGDAELRRWGWRTLTGVFESVDVLRGMNYCEHPSGVRGTSDAVMRE